MLDDDGVVQTMCQCRQGFELHGNQRYDYDDGTNSTIIEEFGSITCWNYNSCYQYGCPPGNKSDESSDYCIKDNECTYDYEIVPTFDNEDGIAVMRFSDTDESFDCYCPLGPQKRYWGPYEFLLVNEFFTQDEF